MKRKIIIAVTAAILGVFLIFICLQGRGTADTPVLPSVPMIVLHMDAQHEDAPDTNETRPALPGANEEPEPEVTWDEITEEGVDEALLLEQVDMELLTEIASELQAAIEEEIADERAHPEIVITEGWVRIFEKEGYKKVRNMGAPAMKPLYLILYKSPNAGEYEYLCARILYELSGFDFFWSNSREFLEGFHKAILESRQ